MEMSLYVLSCIFMKYWIYILNLFTPVSNIYIMKWVSSIKLSLLPKNDLQNTQILQLN